MTKCGMDNPNAKHGAALRDANTPEYRAWHDMKQRCNNPKNTSFHNYGARGIRVCPEWSESFVSFLEHIGPRPSPKHTVERLNNAGDYQPGNVRWATRAEQNANRRPASEWKRAPRRNASNLNEGKVNNGA